MRNGIHLRIWSPRAKPLDEVFDDVLKHGRIQLVHDVLAIPLGQNQLRVLQHAEMTRDGSPAGAELLGDLPRGARSGAQKLEDLAPGWVGEGAEDFVIHLVSYLGKRLTIRRG